MKFWEAYGPLTQADSFWSHFSTFELGRAALKKRVLFDRSGAVTNGQNVLLQPSEVLGGLGDPDPC